MEFRLLHVYFSAKRAINKGAVKGSPKGRTNSPAAKRAKRDTKSVSAASTMTPHRLPRTRIPSSAGSTTPELTSPDYTASTRASSTVCQSPGSFATLPPVHHSPYSYSDASCPFGESLPPLSTNNCFSFSDMEYDDLFLSRSFHPVGPGLQYAGSFGSIEPEPAFHIGIMHNKTQSPPQFPHQQVLQQRHNTPKHNSNYDGDTHMQDADHEPLLDILAKPAGQQDGQSNSSSEVHFANQLDRFHNTVCEMIVKSPAKDQAALLSSYASWAKHVAKDPLQRGGGTPSSDNKMIKKEDY